MLNRIFAYFDGKENRKTLSELCFELSSNQKISWPEYLQNTTMLENIMVREILCDGFNIKVQHNPGRIKSTMADVGKKNIRKRSCFLCQDNLPEGQKAILYGNEFMILCNPAPVFPYHFTICHREHKPQYIIDNIDIFLRIMVDLGSKWTVLYNGPQCGASAPDHLHFQTIPAGYMPIEKEIIKEEKYIHFKKIGEISLLRTNNIGREAIILEGDNFVTIAATFRKILFEFKKFLCIEKELTIEEPMINIAGFYKEKNMCILIFPREKHRPDVFFNEGNTKLIISPAVVEMGGVFVAPVEKDFYNLNVSTVENILKEVSLDSKIMDRFFNSANFAF